MKTTAMSLLSIVCVGLSAFSCADREPEASIAPSSTENLAGPPAVGQSDESTPSDPTGSPDVRMAIREATLDLRADVPTTTAVQIAKLTEAAGGYVVSSKATGDGEAVSRIDVTLRVPAAQFQPTLAQLRGLGKPLNEQIAGQDVTEESVDLNARIRTKKEMEQRLLGLLAQSRTVEDSIKVELELGRVRTDIETMQGRAKYLTERTSMATINVSASAPYVSGPANAESVWSRLDRALATSLDVSVNVLAGIIVVAGALLPLLFFAGLAIASVRFAVRIARRRRNRTRVRPTTPVAP
jgi:hypothetical protein